MTIAELEKSNELLYANFNSLVWHHVRRAQNRLKLPEESLTDIVSELWVKLFRTSKPYRNPAGMNLVIVNRLKRTLQEQRKWLVEFPDGLAPDNINEPGISAENQYRTVIRSELQNLTSRELAVIALLFQIERKRTRTRVEHVSRILNRDIFWVSRRVESAKAKLPALTVLTTI